FKQRIQSEYQATIKEERMETLRNLLRRHKDIQDIIEKCKNKALSSSSTGDSILIQVMDIQRKYRDELKILKRTYRATEQQIKKQAQDLQEITHCRQELQQKLAKLASQEHLIASKTPNTKKKLKLQKMLKELEE